MTVSVQMSMGRREAMERTEVVSSNVKSVGYDDEESVLEVEFMSGGVYQYSDVPRDVFEGFFMASSVGRYLHQNVKGVYEFERVR